MAIEYHCGRCDKMHTTNKECEYPKTCEHCATDLFGDIDKENHKCSVNKTYIDFIKGVSEQDVIVIRTKDKQYGGSWKRRGGVGAYMMAARKIDRIEEQLKKFNYDIFQAIKEDDRPEGILDDIQDLRRYLILIEAEMTKQKLEHKK